MSVASALSRHRWRMLLSVLLLWPWPAFRSALRAEVVLSEFLASNKGGLADGFNDTPDWIELQNTGPAAVDLSGWHLTDDLSDFAKWTFPAETLGAGKFLVVFASGRDLQIGRAHV